MEYQTAINSPYTFEKLTDHDEITSSDGNYYSEFFDYDFTPLDYLYRKVDKSPAPPNPSTKVDSFSKEEMPLYFQNDFEKPQPFPNPSNYTSKSQYQDACQKWYRDSLRFCSSVGLPNPISGHYYKPNHPKVFTKEEKSDPSRFRSFKIETWNLLPQNYLAMVNVMLGETQNDPETEFPVPIPRRDPIKFKNYISADNQWNEQTVIAEPIPAFYDSFNDYQQAYKNWAVKASNHLETPPIPPPQFGNLIGLDQVPDCEKSTFIPDKTVNSLNLEWATKLAPPSSELSLKFPSDEPVTENQPLEISAILGIHTTHEEFLKEMIEFGYQEGPVVNNTQSFPHGFVQSAGEFCQQEQILELLQKPDRNFNTILQLLDLNLNPTQISEIMTSEIDQAPISSIFLGLITSLSQIQQIINFSQKSDNHFIRVACFLSSLLSNDHDFKLLNLLIEDAGLSTFGNLLSVIFKYIDPYLVMISQPELTTPFAINCYKFYLLSSFFIHFPEAESFPNSRSILQICHMCCYNIGKLLSDPSYLQTVRETLKSDTFEKSALPPIMIIQIDSPYLHKIFFGPDYLAWFNDISSTSVGKYFLESVIHSNAMDTAISLFAKFRLDTIKFNTMTPTMCQFMFRLLRCIQTVSPSPYVKFDGEKFIKAFDLITSNKQSTVASLLGPTAMIVNSSKVTIKDAQAFSLLTIKAMANLLERLDPTDPLQFREQLTALRLMATTTERQIMIIESPYFPTITKAMTCEDNLVLHSIWDLLEMMYNEQTVLEQLLLNNEFASAVSKLTGSRVDFSIAALMRMCCSIIKDKKSTPSKKALFAIFEKNSEHLATLFQRRRVIFRGNEELTLLIEKTFTEVLMKDKWDGAHFSEKIKNIIAGDDKGKRKSALNKKLFKALSPFEKN